jgi:hypothetical protein
MAVYSDGRYIDRKSGADLTAAQYRVVKQNSNRTVVLATAATDNLLGVLANAPQNGDTASVCGINAQGTFKVILGGTVAFNAKLTTDANGAGVTAATGNSVFGIAQEAGVAGQVIEYICVKEVA